MGSCLVVSVIMVSWFREDGDWVARFSIHGTGRCGDSGRRDSMFLVMELWGRKREMREGSADSVDGAIIEVGQATHGVCS